MNFAEKLIRLRKENCLSQEELADKLGVSRQAVSRWEQNSTYPDLLNLQKLCDVFSVSADYLIRDECPGKEYIEKDCTESEKGKGGFSIKENRFLIVGFIWLFAALCFEISALSTLNVIYLGLVLADILLACMNFFLHFWKKR